MPSETRPLVYGCQCGLTYYSTPSTIRCEACCGIADRLQFASTPAVSPETPTCDGCVKATGFDGVTRSFHAAGCVAASPVGASIGNQPVSNGAPVGAEPHPWYGPCDGFWPDGSCSECAKDRYPSREAWEAGWEAAKRSPVGAEGERTPLYCWVYCDEWTRTGRCQHARPENPRAASPAVGDALREAAESVTLNRWCEAMERLAQHATAEDVPEAAREITQMRALAERLAAVAALAKEGR